MRLMFFFLLILPLSQPAFAADVPVRDFGVQRLYFPETQVKLSPHSLIYHKSQVDWSLESADRKLMSGIGRVRDGVATVELKTPPVRDGVTLKLNLTIEGKTEPFILVSGDVFAGQKKWLESLNLILIDDEDEVASEILKEEEIPFKTVVDKETKNSLILVTNGKISEDYLQWAEQKNHVVVIAPHEGNFVLPQTAFLLNSAFSVANHPKSLFQNKLMKPEEELTPNVFYDIQRSPFVSPYTLLLGVEEDNVVFQTHLIDCSGRGEIGWHYADFQSGRYHILFVTTPIFDNWETSPASRLFLKMIFEELSEQR